MKPDRFSLTTWAWIFPLTKPHLHSLHLLAPAIHWSYTTLILREISVRTRVSAPNTHTHKQTSRGSISHSLSLSHGFVSLPRDWWLYCKQTEALFTLSLSCRLASLDACTCWNTSSSYKPPKLRPLLKVMKWKSLGNVWPLNMFLHVCLTLSSVSYGVLNDKVWI